PNLQAAVQAIRCGGIAGPVTFELQSGVHYGSYSLGNIIGLSASSTLTFTSATGNAADVVLIQDTAVAGTERSIFVLNNAEHIRFQNLTLRRTMMNGSATGGTFPTAHIDANQASFLQVSGCVFQDSVVSTFVSRDNYGINAENSSNVTISGNSFLGFATALALGSTSGSALTLNQVTNNSFAGYLDAITAFDQLGMLISGNTFNQQRPNGMAAVTLNQVSACQVHSNRFSGVVYNAQIRVTNSDDSIGQPTRLYNNSIAVDFNPSGVFGLNAPILIDGFSDTSSAFPDPKDGVELAFNTIKVRCLGNSTSTSLNYGLIHAVDNTFGPVAPTSPFVNLSIYNNNLYAESVAGSAVPSSWSALLLETDSIARKCSSNYNNFYLKPIPGQTQGGNLTSVQLLNLSFGTCSAWTAAYNKDSNSVSLNPVFAGANLSIPLSATFNDLGTPYGGIGSDINGITRNTTTPDIGAFEFTPSPNDVG
ncbi:MAG: right-handed parallel beta-helix repeat-containing protein, partial [Bacteroidota bacterium]